MYWGGGGGNISPPFFDSALDGYKFHAMGDLLPAKNPPGVKWTGGWLGHRGSGDYIEMFVHEGNRTSADQIVILRSTD
jgi:hypothetical protein